MVLPPTVPKCAVLRRRDGAVDDEDEFAGILGDGVMQGFFGGFAGRGHDRFVIVQRNNIEHQFVDPWIHRA